MAGPTDFVGSGLSWPLRIDQTGALSLTGPRDGVDSSLRMILMTAPGERLMRPQFGCRIWHMLFEPINANTLGLMQVAVREAISQWEPRVDVDDVRVMPNPRDHGQVIIEIDYSLKVTNDRRNLVFPFYVIPREIES